jgi:hypothetical protein
VYTSPVPVEWVRGRSRIPNFLAYFLFLLFLCWFTLTLIPEALFGPVWWIHESFPRSQLVLGIALAIGVPWGIVWGLLAPMPPEQIGISPAGLILDYGLRWKKLTWHEAATQNGRAFGFWTRWLVSIRIPVSAQPFERLAHFVRSAPSSR